jgi:hypothetical protein
MKCRGCNELDMRIGWANECNKRFIRRRNLIKTVTSERDENCDDGTSFGLCSHWRAVLFSVLNFGFHDQSYIELLQEHKAEIKEKKAVTFSKS